MGPEEKLRGYLRRVTGELLEAREQLAAARGAEPVAIIGMACRFPGGVSSPEDLWQLLIRGDHAGGGLPVDRNWNLGELADGPGGFGFLADAGEFDAEFFEISPREAAAMDPQHRLLLETAWEALERAGIAPDSVRGSRTGTYVGIISGDHAAGVAASARGASGQGGFFINGAGAAFASGRIAYSLDLHGPTVTVDTACSSALVALHDACRGLSHGDCTLALVGAAAVLATPATLVEFARQGGLALDGRCKPFGAAADGTAFAEGVGVLVLERLSDARRAGHEVLAVIRGSSVNSDGASNGISAPNGAAQEQVIRQALTNARLTPDEVDAVEAHGTGTTLGDPIEARALLATYGAQRDESRPLLVGSVKSNLGHTQAAAGLAGLIKMVLAMRHGVLPASLGIDRPTPHVDWSGGVELLTEARPWPSAGTPRRAGVSSFSLSGTNAHVLIEEAPAADTVRPDIAHPPVVPWVLSAKSAPALRAQAMRLLRDLDGELATASDSDIGFSLATSRATLRHRAVVVGADRAAFVSGVTALADQADAPNVAHGVAGGPDGEGAVFVFPGQGQQWAGMGARLLDSSPVFAARVADCAAAFAPYLDWSIEDVLRGAPGARGLDDDEVIQVALFAMMVSLAALWQSTGVHPVAVVGHSQGEFAAACVAGALSLPQAARIVALRNRPVRAGITGRGGMASVASPVAEVEALLRERWGGRLTVAAVNGPSATAVSGDLDALAEFCALRAEQGRPAHRIPIAYASHSAQVDSIEAELLGTLGEIEPAETRVPFYSTVTAGPVAGSELTARYWFENLRRPVDFAGAIRALLADGHRTFVECGAHPSLALGLTELAEEGGTDATVVSTLRRGAGGLDRFLDAAGELHVRGVRVDWAALSPDGARVPLPTYPFQRQRFWLDGPAGVRASGLDSAEHPLLDATLDLAGSARVFIGRISLADQPWLADHTVGGTVLLPGTACVELAAHAAARVGLGRVAELALSAPMFVPDGEGLSVQVTLGDAAPSGARSVTVHSRPSGSDEPWTEHAAGFVESASADAAEPAESWPPAGAAMVGVDAVYERLGAFGLGYGPAFRGLRRMWRRDGELFAEVSSPVDAAGYGVHPALFDAALHAFLADRLDAGTAGEDLLLPFSLHGVTVHRTGATALRVRLVPGAGADEFGVFASDAAGRPVFSVESLSLRPVAVERLRSHRRDALFRLDWLPAAPTGEPPLRARCAVLGADGPDLGPRYADLRELAAAERVPEVVFARVDAVGDALELLQDWVGDERFAGSRLAVVTSATELAGAAARGLVRSAQAEHPGRMVLIDGEASNDTLLAALATGEPEVAVGPGVIRVPRLVRIGATGRRAARTPAGTVLITGGLGALGALVARHLVTARGARSLLLVGRRGDRTPGATELVAELTELGAMVTVAACDIADRAALAEVIAAIPAERPLTSVIHAAGVTDDGVLTALDQDRLHRVLRPKLVAAVHLHELTREHDLDEFVLFSSLAGVLGNPGQANYAAANAALDALAETRRALGLPGQSLAWGLWADESAVSSGLGEASVSTGVTPMSAADALALFDAATEVDLPVVVAAHLDLVALRGAPRLPRVLRSLVPDQPMAPHPAAPVLDDLTGLSRADRLARLVDLVRAKAALVLGHDGTSADGIEPDRAFKELGFDSLTAVELRNQLGASTGLRLSPTLVFDFPTPADLAAHLDTALSRPAGPDPVETAVDQVRSAAQGLDDASLAALTRRLKDLVREWTAGDTSVEVASASAEELFDLLDEQLGA